MYRVAIGLLILMHHCVDYFFERNELFFIIRIAKTKTDFLPFIPVQPE